MKKIILILITLNLFLYAGTIENIKDNNKVRIGIKYNTKPFGFKDGKKIKGFDIELSKLIIEEIKIKYNLPMLKVFYKKVIPANREQKLIDKKVDMVIATYTINDNRKEKINFSNPYFKDGVVIVQKIDTSNKTVGVLKNSTTKKVVEDIGYNTKEYLTYKEMYSDFDSNILNAISTNESILNDYIKTGKYKIIKSSSIEDYGIGLPKDDEEFKKLIDNILSKLKGSGEFEKLYNKWFK